MPPGPSEGQPLDKKFIKWPPGWTNEAKGDHQRDVVMTWNARKLDKSRSKS